ncbi:hypothetical protein LRH25_11695 [Ideonella azotifigens]|uniref:DUF2062 domain-containing protein n=1 Tax=Ideonella azotifigens TaxID=513160 RepID=A0ABN1JTB0_9BURK|nr:hypothetical protein [Ideonella azotifigens]MCD2341006.1 hypothetical protein [Ideonella azotifigens]
MVSAAASILAEVIGPLVSFVFEACAHLLLGSVRPWRYVLSPEFRADFDTRFANVHPIFKWWNLLGGGLLLFASLAVVTGLLWFFFQGQSEVEPAGHSWQAVKKAEQVVIDKLKNRQATQP